MRWNKVSKCDAMVNVQWKMYYESHIRKCIQNIFHFDQCSIEFYGNLQFHLIVKSNSIVNWSSSKKSKTNVHVALITFYVTLTHTIIDRFNSHSAHNIIYGNLCMEIINHIENDECKLVTSIICRKPYSNLDQQFLWALFNQLENKWKKEKKQSYNSFHF